MEMDEETLKEQIQLYAAQEQQYLILAHKCGGVKEYLAAKLKELQKPTVE